MNQIKRIVILGNRGFIGDCLEESFRWDFSDVECVGLDIQEIDLTKMEDVTQLADIFDQETAVIMCAFIKRQIGDTLEAYEKNMLMTANICRILKTHPVKRFFYFSSAAVYGEDVHNLNITEETPICPKSYYGMAKFASEGLLEKALSIHKESSIVILRPSTIYGPRDMVNAYGPVGFLRLALEEKEIVLWGDGSELRDFVYIDDVVKIVHKIIFSDFSGVLNLATGKSQSFREILNIISQSIGKEINIVSRPRSKAKVDNQFDNSRLKGLIKDFTFVDVKEGIDFLSLKVK